MKSLFPGAMRELESSATKGFPGGGSPDAVISIHRDGRIKEGTMVITTVALKDKILEMYPEIEDHKVSVGLDFDEQTNGYILTFKRGTEALTTRIEKQDADDCMNGIKCVYLGIQVAQFIKNFEERQVFSRKAA